MHRSRTSLIKTSYMPVLIAAILIGISAPTETLAQIYKGSKLQPGASRGATGSSPAQVSGRNYFAVLGEVRYPQAYELPTSAPSLVDLLRFCSPGWPVPLSPHASGQIRIIRSGRVVQQVYYADTLTLTLMPGDVIIAEDKFGQGRMEKGHGATSDASEERVHLCLLGIRDYPILLAQKSEKATIEGVCEQLGQKPEMAKSVSSVSSRLGGNTKTNTRLPHNTVLIFPTGQIDFSRLPSDIPSPYRAGVDQRPAALPEAAPQPTRPSPDVAGRAFVPSLPPQMNRGRMPTVVIDETEDPGSVALDPEPVGPGIGRSRASDRTSEGRARVGRPVDEPKRFTPPSSVAPADNGHTKDPVEDSSPEATKPFASSTRDAFEESTASPSTPEGDAKSELPLSPIPDGDRALPPSKSADGNAAKQPRDNDPIAAGRSLAMQGAGSASDREETTWRSSAVPGPNISRPQSGAFPTPAKSLSDDIASRSIAGAGDVDSTFNGPDWASYLMIGLGAVGLAGITFFGLSNWRFKRCEPDGFVVRHPMPEPPVSRSPQFLDRLINNEFPVHVEPAHFPADLRVHGRPVEGPRTRLDAAHSAQPARPHFKLERPSVDAVTEEPSRIAPRSERLVREPIDTAVAPKSGRVMRVDRSSDPKPHLTSPLPQPVAQPQAVGQPNSGLQTARTVKPSRVITEGADIVDRALAALHQPKKRTGQ